MRYEDENIWLTQRMMAELYGVETHTINEHIKKVFSDGELSEAATIRKFRIVQTEGSRQISREVNHYNLQMIIAVGFKVNNDRVVQFRKWANAEKPHMGLTSWENYPDGKIQKYDVSIAKNYLSQPELETVSRVVSLYLDYAEYQASRHIPMTMSD